MSVFIEIMAWIVIVFGAVPVVITLISLEAGRHARNHRHGRVMPSLKPGQTCALSCR